MMADNSSGKFRLEIQFLALLSSAKYSRTLAIWERFLIFQLENSAKGLRKTQLTPFSEHVFFNERLNLTSVPVKSHQCQFLYIINDPF